MKNSRRSWWPMAAGVMALVCGLAADAAPPELSVSRAGNQTRLTWAGAPFHTTTREVRQARVVQDPAGAVAYALWSELDAAGISTSFYAGAPAGGTPVRAVDTTHLVRLSYASFDPLAGEPAVAEGLRAGAASRLHLVQFVAPPTESMRQAIRDAGGSVHQFMTDHTHVVRMSAATRAAVAQLPFVRWVGPYHPAYKLSPLGGAALLGDAQGPPAKYWLWMVERGPAPQERVARRIAMRGGRVDANTPQGFLVEATLLPTAVLELASSDDVLSIDPWSPRSACLDIARQISNTNYAEAFGDFAGEGVRGEVMDTGIRATHLGFQDPPPITIGFIPPDSSHGTSVYGIVFGNGAVLPKGLGLLPNRQQGFLSSFWELTDRYAHTQALVNPNGPYRVVFQTNSWVNVPNVVDYNAVSAELDDIIFDMDIVTPQAQGNYNSQLSGYQAWAKNALSVGGIVHNDTLTRADDMWKGASHGPAPEGRIKPDLAHFYEKIFTTSDLSDIAYWPDMGGTSGATPLTCGHAGLLFQMWHEGFFPGFGGGSTVFASRPHHTTIKAILVNTAYRYPYTGATANLSRHRQGWGMVDMQPIIDQVDRMFIVNETELLTPLAKRTYRFKVEVNEPVLRTTLVYNDPAGSTTALQARINDLSLRLTSPSGTVYWGNNGLIEGNWSTPDGVSNKIDTVENVFIQNPQPGIWLIDVFADQIVQDGHVETLPFDADFALVAAPGEMLPPIRINLVDPAPTLVPPGTPTVMDVTITSGFENPVAGSERLYYRFGPGAFSSVALEPMGGQVFRATMPGAPCASTPQFYFGASGDGGTAVTFPLSGPASPLAATVGTIETIVADNFENDSGWTVENTFLQDGSWERGVPAGNGLQGDPTEDFDGSGKCWVTGLGQSHDVDGGPTVLTSSPYDLAAFPQAELSYARWMYTNDITAADNVRIQISPNGTNWFTLESVGGTDTEWTVRKFRIADFFPPSAQVRLRLTVKDDPLNSLTEAGIDALKFTTIACSNPCYPDCNSDGTLSVSDFGCFQTRFAAGDAYADCNGDGQRTVADFGCFQTKFALGCP